MSTVHLRKAHAGSDSQGHVWPEDGAVVEVDYDHALVLLAIPDGGFSVVDSPESESESESEPESSDNKAPAEAEEVSEVAPEPEPDATPDEKPAPRRGGRPRKTVEEG